MKQKTFHFPLSELEEVTAKYFSGNDNPNKSHIALAIKKCKVWNVNRFKLGLKPYK